jgi:hypothetical protein
LNDSAFQTVADAKQSLINSSTYYARQFKKRPLSSAQDLSAVARLRNRQEYFKIKGEGEASKIVLGNERQIR